MNWLTTQYEWWPKLGATLREERIKFQEIKNHLRFLAFLQLSTASLLRAGNVFFEFFGYGLLGASSVAAAVAVALDVGETPYRFCESRRSENQSEGCVCLWQMITIAMMLAGVACITASILCWVLAYLFIFLSGLWCFQTDIEFELNHSIRMGENQRAINELESKMPLSQDPDYLRLFEEQRQRDLDKLRADRQRMQEDHERERAQREAVAASGGCCTSVAAVAPAPANNDNNNNNDNNHDNNININRNNVRHQEVQAQQPQQQLYQPAQQQQQPRQPAYQPRQQLPSGRLKECPQSGFISPRFVPKHPRPDHSLSSLLPPTTCILQRK
jgi:hypothetical protein